MSKHTLGPWYYEDASDIGKPYAVISEGQGGHKNYIAVLQHSRESSENEKNALLISSAPDLLAALEAYEYWGSKPAGGAGFEPLAQARAAIARARGES